MRAKEKEEELLILGKSLWLLACTTVILSEEMNTPPLVAAVFGGILSMIDVIIRQASKNKNSLPDLFFSAGSKLAQGYATLYKDCAEKFEEDSFHL